jgi:hypothetical protein
MGPSRSGDLDQVTLRDRSCHCVLRPFVKFSKIFGVRVERQPVLIDRANAGDLTHNSNNFLHDWEHRDHIPIRRDASCKLYATHFRACDGCGASPAPGRRHFVAAKGRPAAPLDGARLVCSDDLRRRRIVRDQGIWPLLLDPRFVRLYPGHAGAWTLHGEDWTDRETQTNRSGFVLRRTHYCGTVHVVTQSPSWTLALDVPSRLTRLERTRPAAASRFRMPRRRDETTRPSGPPSNSDGDLLCTP